MNSDSGAWLSAGLSPKLFVMSNNEFLSAVCRRNAVEDPMVPQYTPSVSRESPAMFQCGCDGGAQPKFIDPFGYHMMGCKVGANAIRLHDEVVLLLAKLFRSLRIDAIVEPIRLFTEASGDRNNQRPDILLRNPRGFGRQIILDVAVTGLDNPDQLKIILIVICKSVITKKWLNMATLVSRIDFNLFRLSSLTQGKFTTLSEISFGSRFVIKLLLLKVMQNHLKLVLL